MKSATINDLEIRYDDSICDAQLEKIITLIEKYYEILADYFKDKYGSSKCIISLIPSNDVGVIYIEDFFIYFNDIMASTCKMNYDDYYVAGRMWEVLWIYLKDYFDKTMKRSLKVWWIDFGVGDFEKFSMNLWLIVVVGYFAEQYENDKKHQEELCIRDCLDYINLSSAAVTQKIFSWVLKKIGVEFYDRLLECFFNSFLVGSYPNNILEVVYHEYKKSVVFLEQYDEIDARRMEIVADGIEVDVNELFWEFLGSINAPTEWLVSFKSLLENEAITIKLSDEEQSEEKDEQSEEKDEQGKYDVKLGSFLKKCYKLGIKNGKLQVTNNSSIKIQCSNKVRAFVSLVHEFFHYVIFDKLVDKVNEQLLSVTSKSDVVDDEEINYVEDMFNSLMSQWFQLYEFPSIFFEKIASFFLERKFPKKISYTYLNNFRLFAIFNNYFAVFETWLDLKRRKERGSFKDNFDFDSDAAESDNILEKINLRGCQDVTGIKVIPPYVIKNCSREDSERCGDKFEIELWSRIENIILQGAEVNSSICYFLGNFLADYLIDQLDNDPTIIERMVRCVDEGTLSLDEIIREFNLYDLFNQGPPGFGRKS